MKNPLWKRLPRELKSDFGKYIVIFLFMTLTIGFVSGFLVADDSMLAAYNESFEKYNIEDGNFTLSSKAGKSDLKKIEKKGNVRICENFYRDESVDTDLDGTEEGTMRIYENRTDMDLVCLMEGKIPEAKDEIAIDRMYADNNSLKVGDKLVIEGKELNITGLVALSDYSCLFSDNNDMMFDSVKFGVAIMTEDGAEQFGTTHLEYRYSWQYEKKPKNDTEAKNMSEDFMKVVVKYGTVTGFIPGYANQAIQFTGEDMGSDKAMMEVLLYILIVIIAFVFAVTTNNTITKEASVIGTLRASGYSRRELLSHYISMPIIVTIAAAIFGNMLGYTSFKDVCAGMYYGSYSLPTYETRWNADAFILTTLVPVVLMLGINLILISQKLKLSPLKFLRHDLSFSKRKKAMRLPGFKFFNRFRLRIVLQNKSSYLTLFIGIFFANVLLLFGMMMKPLLDHYQEETVKNMIAPYQYILNVPEEPEEDEKYTIMGMLQKFLTPSLNTSEKSAESFCMESMKNVVPDKDGESITVYGISENSAYVSTELPSDGVLISDGYSEKYKLEEGDTIVLKEAYGEKEYEFTVRGIYEYPGALTVFMPITSFRETFDKDEDYFNGYFSREKITDLDDDLIAATITEDDLTKVSRQLDVSMGEMFQLINVFAVVLFALLIYLLTKLIIEKNATAISMVKILGYVDKEIISLYLTSTTWVVVLSILVSLALSTWTIHGIYGYLMSSFSGWLTLYLKPAVYPEMFAMGMGAYALVALLQLRRIRKIPMDMALKNVE